MVWSRRENIGRWWLAVVVVVALIGGQPAASQVCVYRVWPYPLSVLSTNADFVYSCEGTYSLGVGSANSSTTYPTATSFSLSSGSSIPSGVRAANPISEALYTINQPGERNPQLLTLSLSMGGYNPEGPFSIIGGIGAIQAINFTTNPLFTTVIDLAVHPKTGVLYYLAQGETRDLETTVYLGVLNTTSPYIVQANVLAQTHPLKLAAGVNSAHALDSVKNIYHFALWVGPQSGIAYGYSLQSNSFIYTSHFNRSHNNPFFFCHEWAFDLFSGNIYGVWAVPGESVKFGVVNPSAGSLSTLASLSTEEGVVVSGTLTVDYLTGPAYVIFQELTQWTLVQFDSNSGDIYYSSSVNTSVPLWAIYSPWLASYYY